MLRVSFVGAIGDDDYRWPHLVARRTDRQEPKLLWRGRAVGGSSTINGQIAIRGIPDDYEDWAALGARGLLPAGAMRQMRPCCLSRRGSRKSTSPWLIIGLDQSAM